MKSSLLEEKETITDIVSLGILAGIPEENVFRYENAVKTFTFIYFF